VASMAHCPSGLGTGLQIRAGGFDSRMGLVAQPETLLVGKIRTAVKRKFPDAMIVKIHGGPYQTAGLPDLLVILDGRAYGLEVKKQRLGESAEHARDRATLPQRKRLAELRSAGGIGAVVLSVDEVLGYLPNP
jgi:hypothetical protein